MANAPQKDSVPSDDELFEYYLSILPPHLSVNTITDRNEPTACSITGYGHSKIYEWIKKGRVRTKLVDDGKRKVLTFDILKILFNSPDDKPTTPKHDPLKNRQHVRTAKRVAPQLPAFPAPIAPKRGPGRPRKARPEAEQVAERG